MNNDSFLIEEFDLDTARNICKYISNPDLRNKSVANVVAANFAKKYFQDCEVDTESGLHNIYQVLEDIDISDIYIKDNYLDVRLYFNDNEIFIPKEHFEHNRLPAAYMFIKVNEDLSSGLVTGFIKPDSVDTQKDFNGYYRIKEEDFISFYDVETELVNQFIDDLPDNIDNQVFDYLDGRLNDKNEFYKKLLNSKDLRLKLQNAAKAKTVFNFVAIPAAEVQEEPAENSAEETLEPLESFDTLEPLEAADTDFTLDSPVVEDFADIQDNDTLTLDEQEALPIDNNDNVTLDLSDNNIEILPEEGSIPEELGEQEDISDLEEEPVFELDNDTKPMDIKILNEGDFEEQPEPELDSNASSTEDENNYTDLEHELQPEESVGKLKIEDEPLVEENIAETPDVERTDNFDFSTTVTPSIDSFEQTDIVEEQLTDNLLNELEAENSQEEPPAVQETELTDTQNENSEQIDTLFNPEDKTSEVVSTVVKRKSGNIILPVIGTIVILGAIGYYSYTKFSVQLPAANDAIDNSQNTVQPVESSLAPQTTQEAMPVETVENVQVQLNTNEGNTVSIPAIEQNLDASITVSNLHVEFEIPAGYNASKTAERYFTKMGKIIQLNLKTELLLLTKQPITNKIAVELEYNKDTQKFDVKGITASSGEQSIDDLILRTVKNALNINLNMNMSIFGSVAGNPVLVIKL